MVLEGRAAAEGPTTRTRTDEPMSNVAACDIWQKRLQSGTMLILNVLSPLTFFFRSSCAVCSRSGGSFTNITSKQMRRIMKLSLVNFVTG